MGHKLQPFLSEYSVFFIIIYYYYYYLKGFNHLKYN